MAISVVSTPVLDEVVARLARGLKPERIYLFGSRASGKSGQGSDYDLLVVVSSSDLPRHRREALSYDLIWGLTVPVDIVVLTRAEFMRLSEVKTSLAAISQTNGILLYDRSQGG